MSEPTPNNPAPTSVTAATSIPAAVPQERKPPGFFRKHAFYIWVGGILGLILVAVGLVFVLRAAIREPFTGPTWEVKRERLRMTIVERGTMESAENSDIVCMVQARTKGTTNASTIKWLIDEGTPVKMGDKVIELDDSGFQDSLKTQKNTVNRAYSDWVQARNDSIINASQTESDIKTAEVNLIQKDLELKKYVGEVAGQKIVKLETRELMRKYLVNEFENDVRKESTESEGKFTSAYLQDVSIREGAIETARSDREAWVDRSAWSQRMVKKGFYSLSQADADASRLTGAEIALRKVVGDLDIYRKFELEQNITSKWSDVKEAERALKRVKIQADAKTEQKKADEVAKKAVLDQELDRLHDMEKEEKYYKITSPQDGMVVYYVPEQAKGGSGTVQAIVAQGEPVREGQKLLRIPNLNKMVVNARVHEAMVSKLHGERTRPTGYGETVRGAFMFSQVDPLALLTYQSGFDLVREKFRNKEVDIIQQGEKAAIRVDAYPGKQYKGRVKTVATLAAASDWFSSDVKVYQTMVSVDNEDHSGGTKIELKPGMSAEVTILADETNHVGSVEPVLTIPIQSVVGNVAMGAERKCYVVDANNFPQERDIVVGKSNDKVVEVVTGLQEGEKVVLNPKPLIPEKSGMKPGVPGARRGAEFDDTGKKAGKKGGRGAPADQQPAQEPAVKGAAQPDAAAPQRGKKNKQ